MLEVDLLRAILQDADTAVLRFIYADWLDEHGEPARAELIRVQCQLGQMAKEDAARQTLQTRKEQLLWIAPRSNWVQYLGLTMTWDHLITLFRWRLAEAIAWCRGRDAGALRTPALEPASLLGWFAPIEGERMDWQHPSTAERERTVNALASHRARLLERDSLYPSEPAADCAGGRLLIFDPDATLSDSAAELESAFFDADNVPAWDTWVWYGDDVSVRQPGSAWINSFVVAWVPPGLVGQVNNGIAVNPEECICWASDVDAVLCRKLRAAGLLAQKRS